MFDDAQCVLEMCSGVGSKAERLCSLSLGCRGNVKLSLAWKWKGYTELGNQHWLNDFFSPLSPTKCQEPAAQGGRPGGAWLLGVPEVGPGPRERQKGPGGRGLQGHRAGMQTPSCPAAPSCSRARSWAHAPLCPEPWAGAACPPGRSRWKPCALMPVSSW